MCVLVALAAATAGGRGIELPDGGQLSAPEAGAMLSGLSAPAQLLVAAVLADPGTAEEREAGLALRRWLWLRANQEAVRRGWETVRGESRCEWLAEIVRAELLKGGRVSGRQAARQLHIAPSTFCEGPWPARLDWLRAVGEGLREEVMNGLGREIY